VDVSWDFAPCILVEVHDVSEVLAASVIRAMIIEAADTSETSVNFYQTARLNILEQSSSRVFVI
jgi:hypothetical protein